MENLGIFEEKNIVDGEIKDAINEEISKAYDLMDIDRMLSPVDTVKEIKEYIGKNLFLFNMLNEVESQFSDKSYQVLS